MAEETKVRRSGPGIKPVVGMVVNCARDDDGTPWGLKDRPWRIDNVNGDRFSGKGHGRDDETFDSIEDSWNRGCYDILSTPSPDPGEAPGCKGKPCGMSHEAYRADDSLPWCPWVDREFGRNIAPTDVIYCSPSCRDKATTPADPRDVAIARWPWMEPFRDVKVGDRFVHAGRGKVMTAQLVDWDGGRAEWLNDDGLSVMWHMSSDVGWPRLTPYREAKPVEAKRETWQVGERRCGYVAGFTSRQYEFVVVQVLRDGGCKVDVDDPAWSAPEPTGLWACPDKPSHIIHPARPQAKPHQSPAWACSNGKECRTPGAPKAMQPHAFPKGTYCAVCLDVIVASMQNQHDKAQASMPKPRPQPGYTMPGEHAQLALNGGWRMGWR